MVIVRLSWISGRVLAAQARGEARCSEQLLLVASQTSWILTILINVTPRFFGKFTNHGSHSVDNEQVSERLNLDLFLNAFMSSRAIMH